MDHERILIINVAGIGDFVESSASIRALRFSYPDAQIVLLVSPRFLSYASKCPYINEVYSFPSVPSRKVNLISFFGSSEMFSLIKTLRKKHFDVILDLKELETWKGSFRMAALFYVIGAKYRAGRDTLGKGFFLNLKVPERLEDNKSQAEYFAEVAGLLGVEVEDKKPELWVSHEEKGFTEKFLEEKNIADNDILIGINPGSDRLTRRWDSDRWAEISDLLSDKYGAKIIIFGGKNDIGLANEIYSLMKKKPIIATGQTTIGQLIALLEKCNMFITTDSGPMHIAGALEIPMIVLFGPGDDVLSRPYGNKFKIIKKAVSCSPCYKEECESMECMKGISVEDVLGVAENMIGQLQV